MKILLLYPPISLFERYSSAIGHAGGRQIPLGVYYLAASVRKAGHDVCVIDGEAREMTVSSIGLQLMYGVVFGTIPTSMVGQTLTFSITVTDANGDVDLYSPEYAIKVLP